ncbi:uncharacterized protein LOC132695721 [Cylas formicarius]|uniref:uncharacterized protein LOC132695721 n=1 Tax=Cylas formicarius TaxID=197179 RepID=UPI002958B8B4|nr:uncharacterized protein LOC132695721 [Cylas formicarius]
MEDGVVNSEVKFENMGATTNPNTARLATLQERKKQIEETLSKRNLELRQLCIQEAELTGITPPEMPLEAGETLPPIRRRVGTTYQLNENLLKNTNKDELIAQLELEIQLQTNLAEAALGLANEHNMSKTLKRSHRAEYQKHKAECIALREKLAALLKEKTAADQVKLKKKPRVSEFQDDTVSIATTNEAVLRQSESHHTQLSSKHSLNIPSPVEQYPDVRYSLSISRNPYRNSETSFYHYSKPDDVVTSGIYRLSLNGYREYLERQHESVGAVHGSPHNYYPNQNLTYSYAHSSSNQSILLGQHFSQHSPQVPQHVSQNNFHMSQHSPLSQHSPQMQSHSPQLSQSPVSQHSVLHQRSSQNINNNYPIRIHQDYNNKVSMSNSAAMHRQSSPTTSNFVPQKVYYPSHTIHGDPSYRYTIDGGFRNPHQIQPHQQYEHNGMATGLGGYWKQSDSGEMFWCYSNTVDSNWQRDRRFGSLDRRKNKRIHKRVSPIEDKSIPVPSLPNHNDDQIKTAFIKPSLVTNRKSQDHRQLVRTQSLGSVGQTIDSVYPSDDTSSCESDNRSLKAIKKQKEKEWLETSLDGPISPAHSIISHSQSIISSVLAPEEKYLVHHSSPPPLPPPYETPQIPPPLTPKPVLEIPAESNPSPRIAEQPNVELLNNNMPKNCTVVQAGVCKPYHEETKPFEMSDFYKYSTKFKRSPAKAESKSVQHNQSQACKNLNESFEDVGLKSPYHSPHHIKVQHYTHANTSGDSSGNLNNSLDLSQIAVSEHFSAEMNAWYNDRDQHLDNNNSNSSKSRSSATLV